MNNMDEEQNIDRNKFYQAIFKSVVVVVFLWVAFIINYGFTLQWNDWGLKPRELSGLIGIITMPFLHADYNHLFSNTFPMFFLCFGFFYFFSKKSILILALMILMTGIFTWLFGSKGTIHIGSSGLVYALAFFMVTVSLIKKERSLMAYTLIIVFLYGGIAWGVFPSLFPDKHISWEGHLSGAVTGVILTIFFHKEGPQRKEYFLEEEEEENNSEDEEEITETYH